jgi:hypothetical protein
MAEDSAVDCRLTDYQHAVFEVGGLSQFDKLVQRYGTEPDEGKTKALCDDWIEELRKLQVRIGTLLKTDTVSFLFGAGASVECGGVLFGSVPLAIERILLDEGVEEGEPAVVARWLLLVYLAVEEASEGQAKAPTTETAILERRDDWENAHALNANFEQVVSQIYRWRNAVGTSATSSLHVKTEWVNVEASAEDVRLSLVHANLALAKAVMLPHEGKAEGLHSFEVFLRKLLARPLNLKRSNIFTLNYDTLMEQAADGEGISLVDGFAGTLKRVFRPETYDQDLYFPAQTTEGRVHRYDRVVHLYKLHGSLTWRSEEPSLDNPFGISAGGCATDDPPLIYPTPSKFGDVLGMPYAELFRRFAATVVRPQSTLFVIGYGFGDEHVNAIIRQAFAVPSFTLVVVDPSAVSDFTSILREQRDSRVWILSGMTLGTFHGFAEKAMPDLREEGIQEKIQATYRALGIGMTTPNAEPARDRDQDA